MHQVPMRVWNEIAKAEPLGQPWTKIFRMTPEEMNQATDKLGDQLEVDNKTQLAYLLVAPLLQENLAISNFLVESNQQSLRAGMPELTTVSEAVYLATQEYSLSPFQQSKLKALLEQDQKKPRELRNSVQPTA